MENYDKAIEYYRKATELNPKNAWTWFNLGVVYVNLKEDEKALESFAKSLELKPDNAWSLAYIGLLLSKHGMQEEALQAYDKAVELAPNNKTIRNSRDKAAAKINKS